MKGFKNINIDYINGSFQGKIDHQIYQQSQLLKGPGIYLDDEFNLFITNTNKSQLNYHTFVRLANSTIIYGRFQLNSPKGLIAVRRHPYTMFLLPSSSNQIGLHQLSAVFDDQQNMIYVLQLTNKNDDPHQSITKRNQSASSTNRQVNPQIKIKIVDRCKLNSDGSLAVYSKFLDKLPQTHQPHFNIATHTLNQINRLELLHKIFGDSLDYHPLISLEKYLKCFAEDHDNFVYKQLYHQDKNEEQIMIGHKLNNKITKRLGIILNKRTANLKSLGFFDELTNLNGIGLSYNFQRQLFLGHFKDNLLVRQYSQNTQLKKSNLSSLQVKQILRKQHLKGQNYIHNCIYFRSIPFLHQTAIKIIRYITVFEKQYQKRNHNSYNDTFQSKNSGVNNLKYFNNHDSKDDYSSQEIEIMNKQYLSIQNVKKPGFILDRKKSKSPKNQNSKSPLKQIRIKGRVFNNSPNRKLSPSPETIRKINQSSSTKFLDKTWIYPRK